MSSKSKHSHILQKARDRVTFFFICLHYGFLAIKNAFCTLERFFKLVRFKNIHIKITINDGCENETTRKMSNKIFIYFFFRCHKNENQLINLMTTCMPYSRWMNVARRQQALFSFLWWQHFFSHGLKISDQWDSTSFLSARTR